MSKPRNYRFAADPDLMVGTPQEGVSSLVSPSGTGRATTDAVLDVRKDPSKAFEGIIEQGRQIASNKQKLISNVIKPMKGLDDKPATPGAPSAAEAYADKILTAIEAVSSISNDAAIAMILEVWPVWQNNGNTWDTFLEFIMGAASVFSNPQDVIAWSKKLFESMQDGAPVFTPEYIMTVALDGIRTKNFTNYQNLLLSLPFYKSVWSKQPVDVTAFSKAVAQVGTLMEAIQTPTEEMKIAMENMIAKQKLLTAMNRFYKGMVRWVTETNTAKLNDAANLIRNRDFQIGSTFELFVKIEMQKRALQQTIGDAIRGLNVVNPPRPMQKQNSNKLFKITLAAPAGPAATGSAGTGTTSTSTSTTSSGSALDKDAEQARIDANTLTRTSAIVDKRQDVIINNIKQINNISEQKTKGLSSDLGLFSSFVTSGNVVKKIDETINLIREQFKDIDSVIKLAEAWMSKHGGSNNATTRAQADSFAANDLKYRTIKQDLNDMAISLKIQRIVLPKELEYFELKEEYDTNVEQLKAPISALMVNSLKTVTDKKGKTTTVNTRVARPIAIKNAWETGKKIVNLLMQISQALQAGTNHSAIGESMAKNATNYYKAAVKQEVENNKMLMDNLANVGLGAGQVNYTPVAVGKK